MTVKGGPNGGFKRMGDRMKEANGVLGMVKFAANRSGSKYVIGREGWRGLVVNELMCGWHSYTDDHRGQLIADVISNSDPITLNTNTPTRVPNTTLQQTSSRCLTHCTIEHRGQLNTNYHHTTYPSSPQLTYDMTTYYNKTDGLSPTTRKLT